MINIILAVALCLCMVSLVFIAVFTLTRCESEKRIFFLALLAVIFLTVLGYLLEITANNAAGGLVAVKVLYLGMLLLSPVFLMFVLDYFDIKANRIMMLALTAIALFIAGLVWTTDTHGLIYTSVGYITDLPIHSIRTTKGAWYSFIHVYTMGTTAAALIILLVKLINGDKRYRMNVILLIAGALMPAMGNVLFLLNLNIYEMNYVPISMTIVSVVLYYNIIQYRLFDIIPKAKDLALQSIEEAFILVDREKNFLHANEAAAALLPTLKLKGQFQDWPFEMQTDENGKMSTPVKFSMSENHYYNANISSLIGDNNKLMGYIIIIQDITESVLFTKKLEEIANTDELTEIANRRHFMELASAQFERTKRTNAESFIILFDADHFKSVNDTYGHVIGDRVLKCIAGRVREVKRPYDIFGRYGGEEFILFVTDINNEDIENYAERIRKAVCDAPMPFDETELTVCISCGVASVKSAGDLTGVIEIADEALYKAKNTGRNKVVIAGRY